MKTKLHKLLFFTLFALMVSSCVPRERIVYFQGDLESLEELSSRYTAKIQADDLLTITVYGRNAEATTIFNQESNINTSGEGKRQTYLVDSDGYIDYPVLGRIKLGGLTRNEAIQYMKGMLSSQVIDPGVSIQITNYKITVLGEVSKPGSFTLPNERITILEALGMAGDLTIHGVRDNVLVVREENGQQEFHRIDLTSNDLFSSPVYYLAQNDVIYVEPNKAKINSSSSVYRDASFIISVTSFLITIITIMTR